MVQNDGVRTLARVGHGDGGAGVGNTASSSRVVPTARRYPRGVFQHHLYDLDMCYSMEEDKWIKKLHQQHGSICINSGSDWFSIVGFTI